MNCKSYDVEIKGETYAAILAVYNMGLEEEEDFEFLYCYTQLYVCFKDPKIATLFKLKYG